MTRRKGCRSSAERTKCGFEICNLHYPPFSGRLVGFLCERFDMSGFSPNFQELAAIEEQMLASRLEAARLVITHGGEKGRSLEAEVNALLRTFLPAEYGLSTGFIAYHSERTIRLTPQLDIIIYDAVRSGTNARMATCDVYPIEAVYGYVEVKASLQSVSNDAKAMQSFQNSNDAKDLPDNSIERCIANNKEFRKMRDRRFWVPLEGS